MTSDELDAAWRLAARRASQERTWESTAWLLCCCFPHASVRRLHDIAKMTRLSWVAAGRRLGLEA